MHTAQYRSRIGPDNMSVHRYRPISQTLILNILKKKRKGATSPRQCRLDLSPRAGRRSISSRGRKNERGRQRRAGNPNISPRGRKSEQGQRRRAGDPRAVHTVHCHTIMGGTYQSIAPESLVRSPGLRRQHRRYCASLRRRHYSRCRSPLSLLPLVVVAVTAAPLAFDQVSLSPRFYY
ncbi:hypothetical protein GW17_00028972 [Ensete ventricosum]|nr:hypothetical protein GW17_00028972 [Ensete ventricosum]